MHSTQKHIHNREKKRIGRKKRFEYRLHRKFKEVKTCTIFRPFKHFRNCIQYSYHPDEEKIKWKRRKRRRSLSVVCVVLSSCTTRKKIGLKVQCKFFVQNVSMLCRTIDKYTWCLCLDISVTYYLQNIFCVCKLFENALSKSILSSFTFGFRNNIRICLLCDSVLIPF